MTNIRYAQEPPHLFEINFFLKSTREPPLFKFKTIYSQRQHLLLSSCQQVSKSESDFFRSAVYTAVQSLQSLPSQPSQQSKHSSQSLQSTQSPQSPQSLQYLLAHLRVNFRAFFKINLDFYRTHVSLGSDLWVRLSQTK